MDKLNLMKKVFLFALVAFVAMSCSVPARLMNSVTHKKVNVVDVFADLDISTTKITYFYVPTRVVRAGGDENIIKTAIREALVANGNADGLVGVEKQIKYNEDGEIESVAITGYPAKYINFRHASVEDLAKMKSTLQAESSNVGIRGALKIEK